MNVEKTFFYWRCGIHGGLYVTKGAATTSLGVGCSQRRRFDPYGTLVDVKISEEEALRLLLGGGDQ